jgi:hypothetical protein
MEKFSLSDRYRLEIHWKSLSYERDGLCKFDGAYFSGPALQDALRLNDKDHIMLDFFKQYLILVKNVYVARFEWKGVEYRKDGTIQLKESFMSHDTELNRVPKLASTDYLIIDTRGHDAENHHFNLVYKTYVVNEDTQLYKFGGK